METTQFLVRGLGPLDIPTKPQVGASFAAKINHGTDIGVDRL